jgi:purine-binding chemotaxis protein CheW
VTGEQVYFVFTVGELRYALPVAAVRETVRLPWITSLPGADAHVAGVINLRGTIIPVLDLDVLFGQGRRTYRLDDALVVIEAGEIVAGVIANAVSGPVTVTEGDLQPLPFPSAAADRRLVAGLCRSAEGIVMLLDAEALVAAAPPPDAALLGDRAETDGEGEPAGATDAAADTLVKRAAALAGCGETDTESGAEVAVVSLAGEYFMIELRAVQEFLQVGEVTPLPNCPDHVLGNMNVRGSILTLFDVRALLALPPGRFSRSAKVVVVANGDIVAGLAVDDVHDIAPLEQGALHPLPSPVQEAIGRFAKGTVPYAGRSATVLSVAELVRDRRLVVHGVS